MSLISIDPFEFIATIKRDTKIFQWVSLLFQMGLSSVVSFCGTTGISLVSGAHPATAIGAGLSSIAVVLVAFFSSSPLTRGMMLVRPEKVAELEIKTGMATTTTAPPAKGGK